MGAGVGRWRLTSSYEIQRTSGVRVTTLGSANRFICSWAGRLTKMQCAKIAGVYGRECGP